MTERDSCSTSTERRQGWTETQKKVNQIYQGLFGVPGTADMGLTGDVKAIMEMLGRDYNKLADHDSQLTRLNDRCKRFHNHVTTENQDNQNTSSNQWVAAIKAVARSKVVSVCLSIVAIVVVVILLKVWGLF